MSGSAWSRNHQPRGTHARQSILTKITTRSPEREKQTYAFLLTKTYMDAGNPGKSGTLLVLARIMCFSSWHNSFGLRKLGLLWVWQVILAHLWQLTLAHLWQLAGQGRGMEMRCAPGWSVAKAR
ncbi:MAG: hypothetical protein ACLPZY_08905, partial [Terracidiphilus sp.]